MPGLLLVWQVALCEEPAGDAPTQGAVTEEIIEAKIQEVESSSAAEAKESQDEIAAELKLSPPVDADAAVSEATRRGAEGKYPLVRDLAERNASLTEVLSDMTAQLTILAAEQERIETLASQIEGDFDGARETIAVGGLSEDLGHMLLQQRQGLPDRRSFDRMAGEWDTGLAKIGVQRLRYRAEAKRLRDLEAYAQGLVAGVSGLSYPG